MHGWRRRGSDGAIRGEKPDNHELSLIQIYKIRDRAEPVGV